jgi:drug/metabolite transporter (DMT)-like permease
MLTILLASTTSLLFGCSDFLGGLASRRDSAFAVTANAHLVGLVMMAVAVLLFPAPFHPADLLWGAAAGISGGIGVVALYGALAVGRMGVVAPLTAALSGSLPAIYDLLRGTTLRPLSLAGLAIALVAIVVVSASGNPDERAEVPPRAIALAVLAGVGFSGCFILLSFASKTGGLMPLLAARVASVTMLMAVTFARRGHAKLASDALPSALGAGALDSAANITMLAAIRIGPLAVASVLGSLYPVVTILLARFVLGERLRPVQRAGVVLALAAVMLTAIR